MIYVYEKYRQSAKWYVVHSSGKTGIRNPGFGYLQYRGEMGILRQVEQGFSSLFVEFLPYFKIFQSSSPPSVCSTLKNKKMAKIWQKMKKSHVQLALHPFSWLIPVIPENRVAGTRSATSA